MFGCYCMKLRTLCDLDDLRFGLTYSHRSPELRGSWTQHGAVQLRLIGLLASNGILCCSGGIRIVM